MLGSQKPFGGRSFAQVVALGVFASCSATLVPPSNASQSNVCLTPGCVQAAAHVLNNLHPQRESIDPCENFDQYVCGGFPTVYSNEQTYDTLGGIQSDNSFILREILEKPFSNRGNQSDPDDKVIFDMMVKNYNSCMDNATVESSEPTEVQEMVLKLAELFPVEDYSSNEAFKESDHQALADAVTYLARNGVPLFGDFWTSPDFQNPDVVVPFFGLKSIDRPLPVPSFVAASAQLESDEVTEVLRLILPTNSSRDAAPRLADSLLKFMLAYSVLQASIPTDPTDASKLSHQTTTVEEATKAAPNLVLDKVIDALAPSDYTSQRMVFQFPETYANLSSLISQTPRSTIQAFIFFTAYNSLASYVAGSSAFISDRWEFCFKYVDESLPWIASKFFIDAAYTDEERDVTKTMAEELQQAFIGRVETRDWITNSTRALIKEKAEEMIIAIGAPENKPNVLSSSDLAKYYSPINITSSLASNVVAIRQWAASAAWSELSESVDRTIWPLYKVSAYTANARYDMYLNKFMIPAGISQSPFLFPGAPSYLSYGSIGFISGHEITHGFDSNGRQFNNDRQFKDWWDDKSVAQFTNRTRCFVEQYSNIQAVDHTGTPFLNVSDGKPLYVNGALTLGENIADAGGIGSAFDAWKKHEASAPSQTLPGLECFTKEQMFYVSAGQTWCSKFTAESMSSLLENDVHAPPFARIKGFTQNSRGFREAFQCKEKKPTCELW